MSDEIICGVNVRILKEQCERLAAPIRANTRSFQFASALDNSVSVINELQSRIAALEAQVEGMRVALERISNCGQSAQPDHWLFRQMAREIARAALASGAGPITLNACEGER